VVHEREETNDEGEIGAADRGGGDAHDRVARVANARVWHYLVPDVFRAVPAEGLHGNLPCGFAARATPGRKSYTSSPTVLRRRLSLSSAARKSPPGKPYTVIRETSGAWRAWTRARPRPGPRTPPPPQRRPPAHTPPPA